MRDPRIAPKGWGKTEKFRREVKLEYWHAEWSKQWRGRVEFRPDSRTVEDSDYNQHYVDIEAPVEAEVQFGDRSDEISGRTRDLVGKVRDPTGSERLRGAVLAAAAGDAFADSFDVGALRTRSWHPAGSAGPELVEYVPASVASPTRITQLMAYTAESLVRALGARRVGRPVDPVSAVQHGFQRWFHYIQRDIASEARTNDWRINGGIYAQNADRHEGPDGVVVWDAGFRRDKKPDASIIDALLSFATTGVRSTPENPRSSARGGEVLVRAALAGVWSEDLSETFDLAVAIAALTHPHPDDYLAAGTLAVILHQQIRDRPFMDCLSAGFDELVRRPSHEKTQMMVNRALILVQDEQTPTGVGNLRRYFPDGGADGAETLGIALYSAMASDYVREALLLALNYATHRGPVAAAAGMLIGAEYGVQAIPGAFVDPIGSLPTLNTVAQELATELRDVLTDKEWLRRYPPT
ncbi:ADP-ribosylglycohydrolase family protein [Nocardia veterana]|uniref:ADP-ribosylglycohydrolase family protein n=1 Tax=Nocardia veterana TaxID=132249 RepID=A0A7X6LXI7_9NOCA|nr:ADP-ribosylglycohydrolase family protein [Nocardia veterana]NKY86475.1 ADP-ribosylglycohydrolase family protein [Nocardia veterana]